MPMPNRCFGRVKTPAQRHAGKAEAIMVSWQAVYAAAKTTHQSRWNGDTRDFSLPDEMWLNPERRKDDEVKKIA